MQRGDSLEDAFASLHSERSPVSYTPSSVSQLTHAREMRNLPRTKERERVIVLTREIPIDLRSISPPVASLETSHLSLYTHEWVSCYVHVYTVYTPQLVITLPSRPAAIREKPR